MPNPVLLGVLAGVAELIPMVGPFLAFAPALLVALGIDLWTAGVVLVYAVVIQQIESNLLVPRIMGRTVGISPLTVVLGILIGAILYGLPGAFLAVPIAGAIQVIVAHATGLEDSSQAAVHGSGPAREAAAEAAAGAAASAPPGEAAPAAGETGPQAVRSWASSAARRSSRVHLPSPTSFRLPTIERTWLCRNERADASMWISSPCCVTSRRSSVRMGDLA